MGEPDTGATRHDGESAVAHELRALAAQIASLQTEVRRLQSASLPHEDEAGWDDRAPASFAWLSALEPPRRSRVRIPRLPLELAFLSVAAALAGLAHLRPLAIAAVMAGAWLVVALAEWAGSRGDRLRHRLLLAPPSVVPVPEPVPADPAWFSPPVEHTLHAPAGEPETVIARLPPSHDPEMTVERPAG